MGFRDLFNPANTEKFDELREWQEKFFEVWDSKVNDKTEIICVNLPTGCGKTLVGLQVLKKYLIEDKKRCAYITREYTLADKIKEHADELGIPSVIIKGESRSRLEKIPVQERAGNIMDYQRKKRIRISTYDVDLYTSDIDLPEVLVIDDADGFIQNLQDISSVYISKTECNELYKEILDRLNPTNYDRLEAIKSGKTNRNEINLVFPKESIEIANWIVNEKATPIIQEKKYTNNLQWQLKRSWRELPRMLMTFNSEEIIFQPYYPSPRHKEKIFDVPKIILMSATLGTILSIQQELGILNENIVMIDDKALEYKGLKMGNRIIFPIEMIDEELQQVDYDKLCLDIIKNFEKTLVMAYSNNERDHLSQKIKSAGKISIPYYKSKDIDQFISQDKGHLIVASRYYGIDLPSESCLVGIITRIPIYINHTDYINHNIINKSDYVNELISRRLTQAFGRCNRDINDLAIYFVLDPKLSRDIRKPSFSNYFPKLIFKEINLGYDLNKYGTLEYSILNGKQFLNIELENYDELLEKQEEFYEEIEVGGTFDITYPYEVKAWDYFQQENLENSISNFEEAIIILEKFIRKNPQKKNFEHLCWLLYCKSMVLTYGIIVHNIEEYKIEYEEARKKIEKFSKNPFYNRFIILKPDPLIDENDDPNNLIEEWVNNPAILFGEIWESNELEPLKENITQGLRALSIGSDIPAIKSFSTDLEAIMKEICNSVPIEVQTIDDRRATLNDYITNLKSNNIITKETLKIGVIYVNNPLSLRNGFIHNNEEVKNRTESVRILLKYIEFICRVFSDLNFIKLLENYSYTNLIGKFKESGSPIAKDLADKGPEVMKESIIDAWVNGSLSIYFNPEPEYRESLNSYSGDMVFKSRGMEPIYIPIRLIK